MPRRVHAPTVALGLALAAAAPLPSAVEAGKILVANDGFDSSTCGAKKDPCRSLTRAIQNAVPGDTIIVGPGRYGELTGDGTFNDAREEDAAVNTGCDCVVDVTKPLSMISRDGAGATIIDAGGVDAAAVKVSAANVQFGKLKRGFTLLGAGEHGLEVTASDVAVAGNRMVANAQRGMDLQGDRARVRGNELVANVGFGLGAAGDDLVIVGNRVIGNVQAGFVSSSGDRGLLQNNFATSNGESGFVISGTDWTITGNVASGGDNGFFLNPASARGALVGNVANGNRRSGFVFQGPDHVLRKNSAVGNGLFGILMLSSASGLIVDATNVFSNNGSEMFPTCGILNSSGHALTATGSYWGAPDGPGPDPADNICTVGGAFAVEPVAEKEIKVAPKVAR